MKVFSRRRTTFEFTAAQLCAGGGTGMDWKTQVELGRAVVRQFSPDELQDFDEIVVEYRRDPVRAFEDGPVRVPVGMGIDLALVTPYALALVSLLMNAGAGSAATKAIEAAVAKAAALRRGRGSDEVTIELDDAEERLLLERITEQGVALGLDRAFARALAESVLGALLAPSEDEA
ncbi:hypothetical protein [Actinomadura roseirufa]|uniref:hypothetical protein n=1 Tax=Actinomadura roseirufa TaxID=2094049 RepID=UPI001040F861|nr:hypothetical protein [Actinomadura roseirufa]